MRIKPIKYREWSFLYKNKQTEDKYRGTWLEGSWVFTHVSTVRPLFRWWQRFRKENFPKGYRVDEIYLPDFWAIKGRDVDTNKGDSQ